VTTTISEILWSLVTQLRKRSTLKRGQSPSKKKRLNKTEAVEEEKKREKKEKKKSFF
jgi:hypothetical protein